MIEILGYAAATLTTVSFVPQAIKTLRSGDTAAISLRMYLLFTSGIALWGVYGLLKGDGPLIAANAITLVSAGLILQCKLRAVLDPASAGGQRALAGVCGELQVLLPIEGLVDLEALRGRLEKDIAKAEKEIKGLAGRLANPNFADKAPAAVVAECRANLAEAEAQAELARRRLGDMG